eukprot:m.6789 g.6789  ORF g.6789 m.6789 type:complete len:495 (+) comp5192_c0_seq1:167-1651(+)
MGWLVQLFGDWAPTSNVLNDALRLLWDSVTNRWVLGITAFTIGFNVHAQVQQYFVPHLCDADGQPREDPPALLSLLYSLAEDQSDRDGMVHHGVSCNVCEAAPICGVRYKCGNCPDYDVCEQCEAKDTHNPKHHFVKIRVPIPPGLYQRSPLFDPILPTFQEKVRLNLPWNVLKDLERISRLSKAEIICLFRQFSLLAVVLQEQRVCVITREVFNSILRCGNDVGRQPGILTAYLFQLFDFDEDGYIGFQDMVIGVSLLTKGSLHQKASRAFAVVSHGQDKLLRSDFTNIILEHLNVSLSFMKEIVGHIEDEILDTFKDAGDRPVSAIFTAPFTSPDEIPPSKTTEEDDSVETLLSQPSKGGRSSRDGTRSHLRRQRSVGLGDLATPSESDVDVVDVTLQRVSSPVPSSGSGVAPVAPPQLTLARAHETEQSVPSTASAADISPAFYILAERAAKAFIQQTFGDRTSMDEQTFVLMASRNQLMIGWVDLFGTVF